MDCVAWKCESAVQDRAASRPSGRWLPLASKFVRSRTTRRFRTTAAARRNGAAYKVPVLCGECVRFSRRQDGKTRQKSVRKLRTKNRQLRTDFRPGMKGSPNL